MKAKPLNTKEYMIFGHQIEDIGLVLDALSLVCMIGAEGDPPETVFSIVSLALDSLRSLLDRIEDKQEIAADGMEAKND